MKNKFMMIRATEEEKNIANAKAQELGMNLSSFVRFLIRQWELDDNPRGKVIVTLNKPAVMPSVVDRMYGIDKPQNPKLSPFRVWIKGLLGRAKKFWHNSREP